MPGVVGIDLGTACSVVAHLGTTGVPEVILDEYGSALVPSVVSFAGGTTVVGAAAKADQGAGKAGVASCFKRSMGDPDFLFSFAGRDHTATDLSALVLAELKARAERVTGAEITHAVITVPAHFTHLQRTATIDAGQRAGLEVLRIISEPTAAALACARHTGSEPRRVLVHDLGSGAFDVSLVEISADGVRVIATAGDHRLGGQDWDNRLVTHLRQTLSTDHHDERTLLAQAQQLKHTLSVRHSGEILVGTGRYPVTRQTFEDLTRDLLDRTESLARGVLTDAEFDWDRIDGVVPVGGCARMPMVRARIAEMSGRPAVGGVHPDQAVAVGAALAAAAESDRIGPTGTPPLPGPRWARDVTAHSLDLIAGRSRSVLIRKNTPIPTREQRPHEFHVHPTGDNVLEIVLTQGETPDDRVRIGRYSITGFGPGDGLTTVDIVYEYDQDGVVRVSATDRTTTRPLLVTVDQEPTRHDVKRGHADGREPPELLPAAGHRP